MLKASALKQLKKSLDQVAASNQNVDLL